MKKATAVKLKSLTMGTVMGLLAPLVASGEAIGATLTANDEYTAQTVGLIVQGSDAPQINPLLTTTGDPSNYLVNPGEGYDGVVELILQSSGSANRCTGALLPTGAHILTAAHCVTDTSGNKNVVDGKVNFDLGTTENASLSFSEIFIHKDWTYNLLAGNDIAILELAEIAPDAAERFDIYRQKDEAGQVGDKVGYGKSGNGNDGSVEDSGTKRQGQNLYDATGEIFNFFGASDNTLVYDFDNGLPANDAFGYFFGSDYADLGLGADEVNSAPGDSGGPTFIDGLIAGITSFGMRTSSNGASSDIDNSINASFGEFSFDTRVSLYADWIDNILDAWDGGGDVGGQDPGDVVGEDPGDVGGEDPGDVGGEDPGDVVGEDPGDVVGEDPGDVVGEDPGDVVGEDPGDVGGEDPGDVGGEDPGDVGGEDPGDVGGEDPGDVVGGDPGGEAPVSVPEPSTLAGLMVLGAGLLLTGKKR